MMDNFLCQKRKTTTVRRKSSAGWHVGTEDCSIIVPLWDRNTSLRWKYFGFLVLM